MRKLCFCFGPKPSTVMAQVLFGSAVQRVQLQTQKTQIDLAGGVRGLEGVGSGGTILGNLFHLGLWRFHLGVFSGPFWSLGGLFSLLETDSSPLSHPLSDGGLVSSRAPHCSPLPLERETEKEKQTDRNKQR